MRLRYRGKFAKLNLLYDVLLTEVQYAEVIGWSLIMPSFFYPYKHTFPQAVHISVDKFSCKRAFILYIEFFS